MRFVALVSASTLLLGCQGNEPSGKPTPAVSAPPAATAAATAAPKPTTPPATAAPSSTSSAAPSASAAAPSSAASDAPSSAEWESAAEVRINGSTALGCDTKRVREWVGVFCAKPNDSGGTPVKVKVEKAETILPGVPVELRHDVKVTSQGGKMTLVARYVSGTDVEAAFTWSDKEKHFTLWWAGGKPEPMYLGAFK